VDNNDNEFQPMRRKLIQELEEIEQGTSYSWILFVSESVHIQKCIHALLWTQPVSPDVHKRICTLIIIN
jgi:hypothetical protein